MGCWGAGGRRGDKLRGEGLCLSSGSVTEGHRPRGAHDGHRFSRLACQHGGAPRRIPFLACRRLPSRCTKCWGEGSGVFLFLESYMSPHTPPKAPTLTPSLWGFDVGLWGDTDTQSIAASHGPCSAGWQEVGSRRTGPGGQVGRGARMGRQRGRTSDVAAAGVSGEGSEQGEPRG